MRILVAGINGLVGTRAGMLLEERGHSVTGLGLGPRRCALSGQYLSVNLADEAAVVRAVRDARPEVVLNAASMTDVDACERLATEALRVNGIAPGILAIEARELGAHLVHVSTDYVFDGVAGPYAEDAIPNPRGVYALTKCIGEQAVRAVGDSWAVARTAVVYGWPPAARQNFGSWLLQSLRSGTSVSLFEDQFVSPSLADSVAEQLVELVERRLVGVWNTCGAEVVNRVQFGLALCEEFGLDPSKIVPSRLVDSRLKAPRPVRSGLCVKKALAELRTRPLSLAVSLQRFHQAVALVEGANR